jgi:hypothetical protein
VRPCVIDLSGRSIHHQSERASTRSTLRWDNSILGIGGGWAARTREVVAPILKLIAPFFARSPLGVVPASMCPSELATAPSSLAGSDPGVILAGGGRTPDEAGKRPRGMLPASSNAIFDARPTSPKSSSVGFVHGVSK